MEQNQEKRLWLFSIYFGKLVSFRLFAFKGSFIVTHLIYDSDLNNGGFCFTVSIYLLKFNNKNTRTSCEICSKLTIKTPEWSHWCQHFSHLVLVFLLLTLNMWMATGFIISLFIDLVLEMTCSKHSWQNSGFMGYYL